MERPTRFSYSCGKGVELDPVIDAYGVAATDHSVLPGRAVLYVPFLCKPLHNSMGQHEPSADLVVLDSGSAITGYRVDVFTGEGPGPRSNMVHDPNALFNVFNQANAFMDVSSGQAFRGPTAVFQIVYAPPEVVFPSLNWPCR
jgi:3D (Asp-Asp-Asp) domain-containing protein